jgi:hypothetical protein
MENAEDKRKELFALVEADPDKAGRLVLLEVLQSLDRIDDKLERIQWEISNLDDDHNVFKVVSVKGLLTSVLGIVSEMKQKMNGGR